MLNLCPTCNITITLKEINMSNYLMQPSDFLKVSKKLKKLLEVELNQEEKLKLSKVQEILSQAMGFRNFHSCQSFFKKEECHVKNVKNNDDVDLLNIIEQEFLKEVDFIGLHTGGKIYSEVNDKLISVSPNLSVFDVEKFIYLLTGETDLEKNYEGAYSFNSKNNNKINFYYYIYFGSTDHNPYHQIIFKKIDKQIIPLKKYDFSKDVFEAINKNSGLICVSGRSRSGRTTLLNSMVGYLAKKSNEKILTYESPIEYNYTNLNLKNSVLLQSEFSKDFSCYSSVIQNSFKEKADTIMVGGGDCQDIENIINNGIEATSLGQKVFFDMDSNIGVMDTIKRSIFILKNEDDILNWFYSLNMIISPLPFEYKNKIIFLYERLILNEEIKQNISKVIFKNDIDDYKNKIFKIIYKYLHSFYEDAEEKYNNGLISKKALDYFKKNFNV